MTLLEEADASVAVRGPRCAFDALKKADPPLAAELEELLLTQHFNSTISGVLRNHGVEISANMIGRHRPGHRNPCKCRS